MQSRWEDAEAEAFLERSGPEEAARDLALRIYTSRLIGCDPDLVLHGGGNTSVKTSRSLEGNSRAAVIHVKGSGWDLGAIEEPGLPGLALEPLLAVRNDQKLSDPEMVALLRQHLLDQQSPNPSVETLLHAFLPAKFVDHTHAVSVLALANQPNAAEVAEQIFGNRLAVVRYVMPGYDLAIEGARVFEQHPSSEGLWLINHGLFTFGETARQSYERMIEFVTLAEEYLSANEAAIAPDEPSRVADRLVKRFSDELRGLLRSADPAFSTAVLDYRSDSNVDRYLARADLQELARRGTVTPDHVIRIKPFPLILSGQEPHASLLGKLSKFRAEYEAYFQRNAAKAMEPKTMLDTMPRVILVPGMGLFGVGRTAGEAKIAADLAVQAVRVVNSAEAIGRFQPLSEADLFDMEYWSLEQAKLR